MKKTMKKIAAIITAIALSMALMLPAFAATVKYAYSFIDELEAVEYRSINDIYKHMEAIRSGDDFDENEDVKNFLMTADRLYFPKGCVADYEEISSIIVSPTYVEVTIEIDGVKMSLYRYHSEEAGKREYENVREQAMNGAEGCEAASKQDDSAEIFARRTQIFDDYETCYYWRQNDGGYMMLRVPGELNWDYLQFVEADPCRLFAESLETTLYCDAEDSSANVTVYVDENGEEFGGWLYTEEGIKYLNEKGAPLTGTHVVGDSAYEFSDFGVLNGRHTGWVREGNEYGYSVNGSLLKNCWLCVNGMRKYYINEKSVMATGKVKIGNMEYEFGENGVIIDPWGIGMGVKNVTPTGCTIVFNQSGGGADDEYITGLGFSIQKNENGKWKSVELIVDDAAVDALAIILNNGKETEINIKWESWYGELPAGQYRVKKSVDHENAPGDFDSREYFAYFSIGNR